MTYRVFRDDDRSYCPFCDRIDHHADWCEWWVSEQQEARRAVLVVLFLVAVLIAAIVLTIWGLR